MKKKRKKKKKKKKNYDSPEVSDVTHGRHWLIHPIVDDRVHSDGDRVSRQHLKATKRGSALQRGVKRAPEDTERISHAGIENKIISHSGEKNGETILETTKMLNTK